MEYLNFNDEPDRRVFIKGLGYVSLGILMSTLGGCEGCRETIQNRPVRRRLRTGSPEVDADIATYADAVAQMKALPASDPRSWASQAAIHGTVAGGFNFCQHGTDHFFSWHRAYLLYFERICQELTGNADFGLPYWNWNQNSAMHPEFLDSTSALFHPRTNTDVSGVSAVSDGNLDTIFMDGNFFTFGSQLEGSPHNTVHVVVGMDMVTGGSPLDPIFWTHHCMVDYGWAKWNIDLGNDNPSDSAWNAESWNHFVDGDGTGVTVTAGATVLMPLLSYQYEDSPIGSSPALFTRRSAEELKTLEARLRRGADIRFDVKERVRIAESARARMAQPFSRETQAEPGDFATLINSDSATERIFASIEYAQMPPRSDFYVRVFVNLPAANANTPRDDPHYAGSFAFFGTHHEGETHQHKTSFLVNITDTLQRLKRNQELDDSTPIAVQLVAVPLSDEFGDPDAELVLQGIDLIVAPVIIN